MNKLLILVSFLTLAFVSAVAWAEQDFLLPDQAFKISGSAGDQGSIEVNWKIAEGYYLYKNKFGFRTDAQGVELGAPEFPPAKTKTDEIFGTVEVYYDEVSVRVPYTLTDDRDADITLITKSQGCAEQGICYPPHEQTLELKLAAYQAPAAADEAGGIDQLADLTSGLGMLEDDPLPTPEEAFQFGAIVESPTRIRANWRIADGTYLYKDKIVVDLEDNSGAKLGSFELPEAEIKTDSPLPDGTFGDVAVYHNEIDLPLPILRTGTGPITVDLIAKYQGCAERGVCYPPVTQKVSLELPPASEADVDSGGTQAAAPAKPTVVSAAKPAEPVAEQDQLTAVLAEGNAWVIIGLFFLAGLALAFTPCVFPMIPILSGIIAGQGSNITTRKAFTLSFVYVLAMAITYTVAGVLAGMFGENLQAAFQNPWALSIFAAIFVALALSMFGFYELQLPSSLQSKLTEISNKQEGGTLAGVAIMGLLSALIVGPCVAPPLAGALIYIGQTGDAILGGTALFFLSLGMGAPLIAIGTSAGKLLPRAGSWMDSVKAVFGVAMLAVAILLLERVVSPAIAMTLWGALLITSAVYMGALRDLPVEASGWMRLWKGLGLVLLVYGALMLVGVAAGGKDTLQPLRGLGFASGGTSQQHLSFTRIKTVDDLKQKVASASAAGKPVMLDFYADWCTYCIQFEKYTFPDPKVIAALSGFELLQADVTDNDDADKALMQYVNVPAPPAILLFGADGEERKNYRVLGFMDADEFSAHVTQAVSK